MTMFTRDRKEVVEQHNVDPNGEYMYRLLPMLEGCTANTTRARGAQPRGRGLY